MSSKFLNRDIKPFSLWTFPTFPKSAKEVISDSENLLVNLIDLLGCQLFQFRDDILDYIRLLATDEQYRSKLGSIKRKPYDALAELDDEEKEIAIAVTENAMNHLIEQVVGMLSDAPTGYEENHTIQYKLECRILLFDGKKYKIVARQQIGGDPQARLAISFGRWLNMFDKKQK